MLDATLLCESREEKESIVKQLECLRGVDYIACDLSIRIEYEPDDRTTSLEDHRTVLRLFDIIESVRTHGLIISN